MKSSRQEWILLFFSLVLASGGVLMIFHPRKPQDVLIGWTCATMFGACSLVFALVIRGRRRNRAYADVDQVTLAPGTRLLMKKGRILVLGAGATVLGTLFVLCGRMESSWVLAGCGAVMVLPGLVILVLYTTGIGGSNYLLFEPEGLRVGDRDGSLLISWNNLVRVVVSEFNSNPVVCLWFLDLEALAGTSQGTARKWKGERVLKTVAQNQAWLGCDWMIHTWHFGVDASLLGKAIGTYVKDPQVREGLQKHLELEGSS